MSIIFLSWCNSSSRSQQALLFNIIAYFSAISWSLYVLYVFYLFQYSLKKENGPATKGDACCRNSCVDGARSIQAGPTSCWIPNIHWCRGQILLDWHYIASLWYCPYFTLHKIGKKIKNSYMFSGRALEKGDRRGAPPERDARAGRDDQAPRVAPGAADAVPGRRGADKVRAVWQGDSRRGEAVPRGRHPGPHQDEERRDRAGAVLQEERDQGRRQGWCSYIWLVVLPWF